MASYGKCKICGEKIAYSPDHVDTLGAHLLQKHPHEEFGHFALIYEPMIGGDASQCGCNCGCGCNEGKSVLGGASNAIGGTRPCSGKNQQVIKTSISSWKRAKNPHYCQRCCKTTVPLVHRQRSKLTKSPFLECVLLGCWPLCFLPFIVAGSDLFYLYCRECGYYLGMYDRRVSGDDHCGKDRVPLCTVPNTNPYGQTCDCKG